VSTEPAAAHYVYATRPANDGNNRCSNRSPWLVARDKNKLEWAARFRDDLRAHIDIEQAACDWLVELNAAKTTIAAKKMLRDRAKKIRALRPKLTPAQIDQANL
jgi:hypothetical protein